MEIKLKKICEGYITYYDIFLDKHLVGEGNTCEKGSEMYREFYLCRLNTKIFRLDRKGYGREIIKELFSRFYAIYVQIPRDKTDAGKFGILDKSSKIFYEKCGFEEISKKEGDRIAMKFDDIEQINPNQLLMLM
jgi:hypothetical protein